MKVLFKTRIYSLVLDKTALMKYCPGLVAAVVMNTKWGCLSSENWT
jgi:hypothetical protein